MTQPIVEVDHVTKEFILGEPPSLRKTAANLLRRVTGRPVDAPPPFKALDDISFQVAPGEVLGIIGHNGAGKSTLLKILARISQPTKGAVHVRGRVAPLIEVGAGLMPEMTGRENVFLNASILGMKKDEIRRRFDEIVDFAEVTEFIDTPVKRYSSGMKVKLGFSIATSVASEVLIVDEVLAVGDLSFQQKCIERMEKLMRSEGRTVLIVGHNIRQIQRICSRVMILDHGHVSQDGIPQDVCALFFREALQRNQERRNASSGIVQAQKDAGLIEVLSVALLDSTGTVRESFTEGQPIAVRIRFRSKQTLSGHEVVVGLHTSDFVHVLSVGTAMKGVSLDVTEGEHEIVCVLKDIPLRPMVYGLRLGILNKKRSNVWYAENIHSVTIEPSSPNFLDLPATGFINPDSEWRIYPVDTTEHQPSLRSAMME